MSSCTLSFDEHMETSFFFEAINGKICLVLSDGLNAYEEELTDEYKAKIINFIEHYSSWYGAAIQAVIDRSKQVYNTEAEKQDIQLVKIFILFEQNDAPLFGLSFRTGFDVEHGCGIKINGDSFDIIEIGAADVAFC